VHILHLIKTSEGAGWALEFIMDINSRYKNVTFSVVLPSGGKHFKSYFEVCRSVYEFDFKLDASMLKQGKLLRKIVKEDKPDLIHSWFAQTTLYARLFLRSIKTPRLFEVVGPSHLESSLYNMFDIKSAQPNDYWKATSKYTYNKYLKSGVKQDKLFLNYIGVDLNNYLDSMENSPIFDLRSFYNIPPDIKIIGTASYMYPPKLFSKHGVKNHETLLKVFGKLLSKRNDVVLVIGGSTLGDDKRYENKLKKMAQSINNDKIIFTGWANNLGRLINNFDVFVFLSLSENLGGVFESLLFQVPTVSSNRGGIPELVIDGETGFACNLKSEDDIVDKIEILLDNEVLRKKFKNNGLSKVHGVFDKETSLKHSYNIYQQLIYQSRIPGIHHSD